MRFIRHNLHQLASRLAHRPLLQPRQWLSLGIGAAVLVLFIAVFWFAGRPILALASDPDRFRTWIAERGGWGQMAFVGMMALQIFVAIIPGEPLELAAGYAFGAWLGMGLCLAGAALGSMVVFLLVRGLGVRVVETFFPRKKIMELSFLKDARRRDVLIFTLFCIPGSPKDLLTYVSGLTNISLARWLLLTTPARIPSIITSTMGGDALGMGNLPFAAAVFAVTLLISGAGILAYRRICRSGAQPEIGNLSPAAESRKRVETEKECEGCGGHITDC